MARISGVDLPKDKRIEVGLTYIFGIGKSRSKDILTKAGIDFNVHVKDLTESQIILTTPFLFITLHLSQIFLTDDLTFNLNSYVNLSMPAKPNILFCPEYYAPSCKIVWRKLHSYLVSWQNSDIMHPHFS